MSEILYNIFIFPIVQIIEISFFIVYRIFRDRVLAIIGVSAIVTICTMPLYFTAEKWQRAERDLQKKLKPKIDKIKSVFRGDEQYMILSTFYRQNNYHPVYALRNSFGLLIQVPFFIAAYSFLSHLELLKGTSFLFIDDLSLPDRFFSIGNYSLNILPLIMTVINGISGAVYTKGFQAREKIQIYGIALVFLVLLYNSPAGLVLYWTVNNIFSLLKNILTKTKYAPKIVWSFLCLCVISLFIRYIPLGLTPKRLFVIGLCSLIFFAPFLIKIFRFCKNKVLITFSIEQSALSLTSTYVFSTLILLVLGGLVIPGSLIASSVQEFSFLDSYTTPLPFLFNVSIQAFGFFLIWPLCIYFLFSKKIRYALCLILSLLCIVSLVNTFLFPGDYGSLSTTFKFSNPNTLESNYAGIIINALVILGILCICTFFLLTKRKLIFQSLQLIILASLVSFGIINIIKINKDFRAYKDVLNTVSVDASSIDSLEPVFSLSKNGKNIIVLMLDEAISGYVPYVLDEKPELLDIFSGFTYYPNCVSLGNHTRLGTPVIFGGYEYGPQLIQKQRSFVMKKHNEALLMMPHIFHNENYNITVTDPSFANYSLTPDISIFSPYPEIKAMNILGKYTDIWLHAHPDIKIASVPELLDHLLLRFSFFKISPLAFRTFIYDKSSWLKSGRSSNNQLTMNTLNSYSILDFLPQLTAISDDRFNSYTATINELPDVPALFQAPDYVPVMEVTDYGDGPFAQENSYHAVMASFLLLGKWFSFFKEQGVYDNTRIIIVSDHGRDVNCNYTGNIPLPNGSRLSLFHALLLVKNFGAAGNLVTDNTFMTHGDVPLIAMDGLIENPINPFSGNLIESDKENGVVIANTGTFQFGVSNDQWLYVKDNIFDPANWKAGIK
ncbi:MAG: membrane protein insertase YidC [Treponema sp.]|nr:membrane protein insertase YidC [Treponema sp.]